MSVLYQINIGNGGVPKKPVPFAQVTAERLLGDDWDSSMYKPPTRGAYRGHGGPQQAICLFSLEVLDELRRQGLDVFPGALGENFTTQELDHHRIRIGERYQIGPQVVVQITKRRVPCVTIREAYTPGASKGEGIEALLWNKTVHKDDVEDPFWGKSGFYASVVKEGLVNQGDSIIQLKSL